MIFQFFFIELILESKVGVGEENRIKSQGGFISWDVVIVCGSVELNGFFLLIWVMFQLIV